MKICYILSNKKDKMGGNAKVIDRKTGNVVARAQKIDLLQISRKTVVSNVVKTLETIDRAFRKHYGIPIWKNFGLVKSGQVFSGSSEFLMNPEISDEEFVSFKPIVGDIDVIMPFELGEKLEKLMPSLEGTMMSKSVKYLGQDRADFGTTFLGVFHLKSGKSSVNFQIDFEYGEWKEDQPSDWAKFSHNSDWEDIKGGLKGVHHKFLLTNLVRAISLKDDIVIATPSSRPEKIKLVTGKKAKKAPRVLAFSVDKGVRMKYKPLLDNSGMPVERRGKTVFQEVPVKHSVYENSPLRIFNWVFGRMPLRTELDEFKSFYGLTRLIQRKIEQPVVERMFKFLLEENLFGKHAQVLEKNNPELDMRVKDTMVDAIVNKFPFLKKQKGYISRLRNQYYNNFKYEPWLEL